MKTASASAVRPGMLGELDLHLFGEGRHYRLYQVLGAQVMIFEGLAGVRFAVWAPNARQVSVIGDFNAWRPGMHLLSPQGSSGIWAGFIPGLGQGVTYKYHIESHHQGYVAEKADPVAFASELRPKSGSVVCDINAYRWGDETWMRERGPCNAMVAPIAIYEVHLGSWMRVPDEGNRWLTYRELAPKLAAYVNDMGYTHVEFLPVAEHPLDASWGYQLIGFFAPTSRFGTPDDFKFLIDTLHQHGIGVIIDWVPAHFPKDGHGLGYFDGTHLYEHSDPRQGEHRDWGTYIFNYGRCEVSNFLIANALFWLDKYHIDGLRVDAVASLLYLDYSRQPGDWIPNTFGGNENLDAIAFMRRCNEQIYLEFPDVLTFAEESTAWPQVSRPTYVGGLGYGYKWDMGWMHDALHYMGRDPAHRKYHHNELTFRGLYMFSENFVLPLSHDEVVHGKGALLNRMPGDFWQKFANLRLLLGLQYTQPGKKLLFMGGDFGQWDEWQHDRSLDWHLLQWPSHQGIQNWVRDLNRIYRQEAALHALDCQPWGIEWVDCNDSEQSVLSYLRKNVFASQVVLVVFNLTPVPRYAYRVGVPRRGYWRELLNSDASAYFGSGMGNAGGVHTHDCPWHHQPYSIELTLPPLSVLVLKVV